MPRRTSQRLNKTLIENTPKGRVIWDSEIPGFGLRVTPAGTRTFVFQFRSGRTEQGRISIGRYPAMTVDEARKIARVHRVCVDQGGNPSRDRKSAREAVTLSQLAAHYCDVYGPQRGLKPQTISDARRLLDRYALPRFGKRRITDITVGDVRTIHNLTREKVSRYQANKLEDWRQTGGGPRFLKLGRAVRYRIKELDQFADGRLFTNTAEPLAA